MEFTKGIDEFGDIRIADFYFLWTVFDVFAEHILLLCILRKMVHNSFYSAYCDIDGFGIQAFE